MPSRVSGDVDSPSRRPEVVLRLAAGRLRNAKRPAGRVPAAKERLDEGFFVPLAEISGLGRQALQEQKTLRSPHVLSRRDTGGQYFCSWSQAKGQAASLRV